MSSFFRPVLQARDNYLSIWLNSMLEAIQLPAGIAHLDTSLTNMDGNAFSHDDDCWFLFPSVNTMSLEEYQRLT